MASPKSLKRSFDQTGLGHLQPNDQGIQPNLEPSGDTIEAGMAEDHNSNAAPSTASSRLSSPAPSYASSSAVKDIIMQTQQTGTIPKTTAKRSKLTFAEKEAKRIEKEAQERKKAEEKLRKEQEKEIRDRQRVEDKAKKEEEKRAKDLEKEAKRLVQEEKSKAREEEKRKRDEEKAKKEEEKAKKEEEKNKKAKSQLRLNAFFVPPTIATDGSRDSPTRDGRTPTSSRRSSISSLQEFGPATQGRSTSATPKKVSETDYEKLFPPFFVKSHTTLASYDQFSRSEEYLEGVKANIDEILAPQTSSATSTNPSTSQVEFVFKLPDSHFRKRQIGKQDWLSVQEIVARMNGSAHEPVDLTGSDFHKATQTPIELLKAIPMKCLKFAEDVRPPYIGTYTKLPARASSAKLGRNPFTRALPSTNYDYDSEAEWEEPGEGEDLDSEGEEEVDDDDAEDLEGFLDDADGDEVKKRRPIIGDLEPSYAGLCWEDEHSRSKQSSSADCYVDLSPFRLDILLENPTLPIDPYSTSYWKVPLPIKHEASSSRMDPPRLPLHAINRPNLQLPNPSPDGLKPEGAKTETVTPVKAPKQGQVKRYITPELLKDFKAAVQGSELTKLGLVEVLKKQFPKQSKGAIQDTLASVAERVGPKESEKRWILKEDFQPLR